MAKRDLFPQTMRTWIDDRLVDDTEGRADVNQHVMLVYLEPLKAYFLGTSDRWLGEADDIVQGFFADRLARPGFFDDWREAEMPLRRWLMNAFCFYLKEQRRRHKRNSRGSALEHDPESYSQTPESRLDQAFVAGVVRRAIEITAEQCENDDISAHWTVFAEHYCRGRAYPDVAAEVGVSSARAAVMARTAARRFRSVLRDLLQRDTPRGEGDSDAIDEEINRLLSRIA